MLFTASMKKLQRSAEIVKIDPLMKNQPHTVKEVPVSINLVQYSDF